MIAAATRLRIRSYWYFIPFAYFVRSVHKQAKGSPGCLELEVRKTKGLAFWTKTIWKDKESLLAFNNSGAHKKIKPKLKTWCDEAVHTHWKINEKSNISWEEAEISLKKFGRLSTVDYPSKIHSNGEIDLS